ncbi:MAG: hypothetical protein GIW94_12100 [Candidatus Eremiobacteraeota bacterium]|nr:hypothetical protein [Candidatus Eremiobacteraeota bacterium]MBC5820928.1 hypothetical protein [Candidatus Eremiobacteraeota bacterium]
MNVAAALLAQAREIGMASLAVVGTSKNAGKSVVIAALADALGRESTPFGLASLGRDGESVDALEGTPKPRFWLRPGATFATAAVLVPRSPAAEIVAVTSERCALGTIVIARSRAPGCVEIAGPPSAAALRRVVTALRAQCGFVLIDGAVDRIAALRGGEDAIVVAVGAATASTAARAADECAALVAKLRVPPHDATHEAVAIDGALTAGEAAALVRAGERRQIIVTDPTQIAFGGRVFLELARQLDLRCRESLHPIACSVAPLWAERAFEPRSFARDVAQRTRLPVYDMYANLKTDAA